MTPPPTVVFTIERDRNLQATLKQLYLGPKFTLEFLSPEHILTADFTQCCAILADDCLFEGGRERPLIADLMEKTQAPIIFMTALPSPRAAQAALQSGAAAILQKPFGLAELRTALATVLHRPMNGTGAPDQHPSSADPLPQARTPGVPPDTLHPHPARVAPESVFDALFLELERRQPLQSGFDAFDVVEKQLIIRALQTLDGNQSRAARFLGITRNTLRKRIHKYELTPLISKEDDGS